MNRTCIQCQKTFFIPISRKDTAKFCGKSCLGKSRLGRKNSIVNIDNFRKSKIWSSKNKMIEDYNNGLSSHQIALTYECTPSTVLRALKKLGVDIRIGGNKKGCTSWNEGKKYLAITGDRNTNWKGGITPLNQVVRHCIEYKQWVKDILKRDNYTCLLCHRYGGDMEIDHYPKRFKDIMAENMIKSYVEAQKCEELWDRNNGRTLCLKCHNNTKSNFQVK